MFKHKKHVHLMFYAPCWYFSYQKLRLLKKIYFFLTGCGHCKKAKPEFQNAAEQFKDDKKVRMCFKLLINLLLLLLEFIVRRWTHTSF